MKFISKEKLDYFHTKLQDEFVENDDYAVTGGKSGVIKVNSGYGTEINDNGVLTSRALTQERYNTISTLAFISKGTLENIKEELVKSVGDEYYLTENEVQTMINNSINTALESDY